MIKGFTAHDINQAYNEGVRHEQKRILEIIHKQIIKSNNINLINEYKQWEKKVKLDNE